MTEGYYFSSLCKSDCASFFPTVKMSRLFWTFVKLLSRQISSMNLNHINLKNYPNNWGHQVILLLAIKQNTDSNLKSWQIWKKKLLISYSLLFFFFSSFFLLGRFSVHLSVEVFPSRMGILLQNNSGCLHASVLISIGDMRSPLWLKSKGEHKRSSHCNPQLYFLGDVQLIWGTLMLQTASSFSLIFCTLSEFVPMPKLTLPYPRLFIYLFVCFQMAFYLACACFYAVFVCYILSLMNFKERNPLNTAHVHLKDIYLLSFTQASTIKPVNVILFDLLVLLIFSPFWRKGRKWK